MQIARWSLQNHLQGRDPAQCISERRMAQARHSSIGNDDGITTEFLAVRFEERRKMGASHLLFALDQEREIAREFCPGFKVSLDGFEMGEMLAFIVARSTPEKRSTFDSSFEWRRLPKFKRLRRLHVVMA